MRDSNSFRSFLSERCDVPTFFEPLAGNNGDALIRLGAERLIQDLGISLVQEPADAHQIIINGGGAMVDIWGGAGVAVLERYRKEFPDIPLIVAPSSFRFKGIDFSSICRMGNSPLTLFARESYSYGILENLDLPSNVALGISDDLAFELRNSAFVTGLRAKSAESHILVAIRKDVEGRGGAIATANGKWLPRMIRVPLSRLRDRLVAKKDSPKIDELIRRTGMDESLERYVRDISVSVEFEEFLRAINNAALIATDRLHVGILGHLLGKRVFLFSGTYHKNRGVFENSMSTEGSLTELVN